MTRERRCDKCDLPQSMCSCARAAELDKAERAEAKRLYTTVAVFPGTCSTRDGPISPGQLIARIGKTRPRWFHSNLEDHV